MNHHRESQQSRFSPSHIHHAQSITSSNDLHSSNASQVLAPFLSQVARINQSPPRRRPVCALPPPRVQQQQQREREREWPQPLKPSCHKHTQDLETEVEQLPNIKWMTTNKCEQLSSLVWQVSVLAAGPSVLHDITIRSRLRLIHKSDALRPTQQEGEHQLESFSFEPSLNE